MKFGHLKYFNSKLPLIQPRGGRSTIKSQMKLWDDLFCAGADVLPLTIDSKTRLNLLKDASELYLRAQETGNETLNGFPLLSVGLDEARELLSNATLDVSLRHGTPLAFNLVKRAIDIGFGEIEGGPISYCIPYSRNTDLVEVIKNWKKVELYCSSVNLNLNSQIVRENFGVLSACLIPPIQTLLVDTLEALFVANFNGGKIMCSVGATGCDYQDIALVEAIREVVPWALDLFNLKTQIPFISYHHWMGPFPHGKTESLEIITRGTYLSFMTNSEKVVTKTIDEAHGIPSNASNSESVKLVKDTLNYLLQKKSKISKVENYLVEEEREVLIKEVKSIVTILKNEHETIEEIILQSILKGFVDVPFSPHLENKNNLKSLRADDNSIRVTSDFYGNHSNNFVNRETMFLKNNHSWNRLSSDSIVNHILWPNQNKIKDLTDANCL